MAEIERFIDGLDHMEESRRESIKKTQPLVEPILLEGEEEDMGAYWRAGFQFEVEGFSIQPHSSLEDRKAYWHKALQFEEDKTFVDWADTGICGHCDKYRDYFKTVKNQGSTHGCWAFALTSSISGAKMIELNLTPDGYMDYSAQELIDRKWEKKEDEERGTINKLSRGYEMIMKWGVLPEKYYPWMGRRNLIPIKIENRDQKAVYILGYDRIRSMNTICKMLNDRPLTFGVDVYMPEWINYSEGLYEGPETPNSSFVGCHAMVAVGKSVDDNGRPYLLALNSYGKESGIRGFVKIALDVMTIWPPPKKEENEDEERKMVKPIVPRRLVGNFFLTKYCSEV